MPQKEIPKFGAKETLRFVGLKDISPENQAIVQRISTGYFQKVGREVQNLVSIVVNVKCYAKAGKEGKRHKYSIHIKCNTPTKMSFDSCHAHDWDISRATHKAFRDVITQIRHKLRTDVTMQKTY